MDTTERARLRALCEGAATWQQIGMSGATILSLLDALDAAERERDEARAEVERLRADLASIESSSAQVIAAEASRRELMPSVLDAVRKVAREEEREACAAIATPYAARWHCAGDIVAKIRARGAGGGE